MFRKIYYGLINLVRWLPIIYNDRDWDWAFLAIIMQYKIKKMKLYHVDKQSFVGVEQIIKKLTICENLLNRIVEEDYMDNPRYKTILNNVNRQAAYTWVKMYEQQDMDLLFKILNKHLKKFWD